MPAARPLLLIGCALLLAALLAQTAAAGPPASLHISQAVAAGREIRVYLDVRDEAGAAVAGIDAGQLHATVGAHAAQVRTLTPFAAAPTGVVYLFLVDLSRSLSAPRFARIRQALKDWVGALGTGDRAALIGFGDQVRVLVAPTADTAALTAAIAGLAPADAHTALHQALARAVALGRQQATGLPERRVIVTLSDGIDDAPGGISAEEVYAALAEGPIPIYAVGFSSVSDRARREAGLNALGGFARRSGGVFVDGGREDPGAAFAAMRTRIAEVYRAELQCPDCPLDGNRHRLQIDLRDAGLTLTAGTDLRLLPEPAAPVAAPPPGPPAEPAPVVPTPAPPEPAARLPWPSLAGGAALLAVLALAWVLARRRKVAPAPIIDDAAPLPPQIEDGGPRPPSDPAPVAAPVMAPPVPRATLRATFMTGPRRGQQVTLTASPGAVLGRVPGCDLILTEDAEVSSRHAQIEVLANGRLVLRDLGSTNGTRLNGIAIETAHPLRDGDVIGIGQTELRVAL
jgi:Mg-chelatase subunit ChlD